MKMAFETGGAGFIGSHVEKWLVRDCSIRKKRKRVFGDFIHNVPLSKGVAKMLALVKTLKVVSGPTSFGYIEALKNLPPSWVMLA